MVKAIFDNFVFVQSFRVFSHKTRREKETPLGGEGRLEQVVVLEVLTGWK